MSVYAESAESDYVYVKELQKGEPAPFKGGLVPYVTLYQYESDSRELKFAKPRLLALEKELVESQASVGSNAMWFVGGASAGVILSFLLIYSR
jgi:hypothetical protein